MFHLSPMTAVLALLVACAPPEGDTAVPGDTAADTSAPVELEAELRIDPGQAGVRVYLDATLPLEGPIELTITESTGVVETWALHATHGGDPWSDEALPPSASWGLYVEPAPDMLVLCGSAWTCHAVVTDEQEGTLVDRDL